MTRWAYWDTSALVKLYVHESGEAAVSALLREFGVASSVLLTLELESLMRRRSEERRLDQTSWARLRAEAATDTRQWELRAIDDAVLAGALRVIRAHGARTHDAIHLATAELFCATLGPEMPFITADRHQRVTAAALGLRVKLVA